MPAKKTTKKTSKKKAYTGPPRPRGRPPTGKVRTCPMPHIQPEFYEKLKSVATARRRSIAKTIEYAIDIAHLQTFHM